MAPKMRKIIQFELMTTNGNKPMVLCDDGTMWEGIRSGGYPDPAVIEWRQLPLLPGTFLDALEHLPDASSLITN